MLSGIRVVCVYKGVKQAARQFVCVSTAKECVHVRECESFYICMWLYEKGIALYAI